jgi:hypothetical protein
MLRTNVNEMNVQPIDLGDELRQGVEPGLHLAPVVIRAPITHHLLEFFEPYTLGAVADCLPVGPSRGGDASAKINELLLRNIDAEGANGIAAEGGGQL